jgi:CBS domain-containing protein
MPFFSELIGKPVIDIDGKRVGKLVDLVAHLVPKLAHPLIEAIVIERHEGLMIAPYSIVAAMVPQAIPLNKRLVDIHPYQPEENDVFLARDVLDKQIIDTEGARVVRVNDLELVRVNGTLYVGNVDVGGSGILRRLGTEGLLQRVASRVHTRVPQNFISWDNMELLLSDQSMRLKVPVEKIKELHPADVAEILSDLNRLESGQFLEAMDVEDLADALEEVEPDFQASLIEGMTNERVADILEEMEPDEAADLLAELPKERSEDLLALMQMDEAEDVRRLLTYPEDSAGGIMTTEFVAVRSDLSAEQTIQTVRETADAEMLYYIYVTDVEDHLIGVFSLSSLILADPKSLVLDFMQKRVVSVELTESQDVVAQMIAKYDLMAIPVVDEQEHIQGIVTADDALDKIIPTAWKKRMPRFFR